jgi:hypothetical protein
MTEQARLRGSGREKPRTSCPGPREPNPRGLARTRLVLAVRLHEAPLARPVGDVPHAHGAALVRRDHHVEHRVVEHATDLLGFRIKRGPVSGIKARVWVTGVWGVPTLPTEPVQGAGNRGVGRGRQQEAGQRVGSRGKKSVGPGCTLTPPPSPMRPRRAAHPPRPCVQ